MGLWEGTTSTRQSIRLGSVLVDVQAHVPIPGFVLLLRGNPRYHHLPAEGALLHGHTHRCNTRQRISLADPMRKNVRYSNARQSFRLSVEHTVITSTLLSCRTGLNIQYTRKPQTQNPKPLLEPCKKNNLKKPPMWESLGR